MNLFALDPDPARAAQALCDRHVVKMTLETAQILCTVAWMQGMRAPYRPTHKKHPCVLWTAASTANWRWVVEHGIALGAEFERRFGKVHKSLAVIEWAEAHPPPLPERSRRAPFAQAMPDAYRTRDAVIAYRRYYVGAKQRFATWRAPSRPPRWWSFGLRRSERTLRRGS